MSNDSVHTGKALLIKVIVAITIILLIVVLPASLANAVTAPKLTKSSLQILLGRTYNLNITSKIDHSTYAWSSSNESVATIDKLGYVTAIKKGNALITCIVTSPVEIYRLTCKVKVIRPAIVFRIKNKISALNVGQVYDIEELIAPASANDIITWHSSDTSIAEINKAGEITTLKEGRVKITGKTFGGKTDSMIIKIVDKDGTVASQEGLLQLLGTGVGLITIKTNDTIVFSIPGGDYTNSKLVVDAPNADIYNLGRFSSIDLKQIASNSWYEDAVGNLLTVLSLDSRIVVGSEAKVKIEVNAEGAKLRLENDGVVEGLVINGAANIDISGKADTDISGEAATDISGEAATDISGNAATDISGEAATDNSDKATIDIPVVVNASNITISTSVPLNLNCTGKLTLVLLTGSENTTIQVVSEEVIPTIQSDNKSLVEVVIGTGDTVKVLKIVPASIETPGL